MKTFLKKNTWVSSAVSRGWGNGYVALPRRHPYFGLGYDEINEKLEHRVHGGLTFSKNSDDIQEWEQVERVKDMWIIGWDTAHWGDTIEEWPRERVLKENQILSVYLAKAWNDELSTWLLRNSTMPFEQSEVDPSLYIYRSKDGKYLHLIVYIDDLLIYSKNLDDHLKHLELVAARLKEYNIQINMKKQNS